MNDEDVGYAAGGREDTPGLYPPVKFTGIDANSKPEVPERGLRYNSGKLRYDLLPPDGIRELVRVYTRGAEKYAPRNWELGMPWMECYASMQRHASAWAMGEDVDAETGLPHMAHAAWNALTLVVYALRGVGTDDRVKL